jgi:hypothetical protein
VPAVADVAREVAEVPRQAAVLPVPNRKAPSRMAARNRWAVRRRRAALAVADDKSRSALDRCNKGAPQVRLFLSIRALPRWLASRCCSQAALIHFNLALTGSIQ